MTERFLRSPMTMGVFLVGLAAVYALAFQLTAYRWALPYVAAGYLAFAAAYFSTLVRYNARYPAHKIRVLSLAPYELKEEDEGHQFITYRACRKVYVYYYFALPCAIVLVSLFHEVKLAPLFVLVGLGLGQYTVFWSEIRKLHT